MATNTPNAQIQIFKNHFPILKKRKRKETGVLENGADSSSGTRYAQNESEIPDSKKTIEDYQGHINKTYSQLEEAATGPKWDNLAVDKDNN